MDNSIKAKLWDICKQNHVFDNIPQLMNERIVELFEDTIKDNLSQDDFLISLKDKLEPLKQLNYADLTPKDKQPDINFAIGDNDEPIHDMNVLLEQQANDRKTNVESAFNHNDDIKQMIEEQNKMMNKQNTLLVKIIETQIKIYESLQKK
jgi:hypothetical protein